MGFKSRKPAKPQVSESLDSPAFKQWVRTAVSTVMKEISSMDLPPGSKVNSDDPER